MGATQPITVRSDNPEVDALATTISEVGSSEAMIVWEGTVPPNSSVPKSARLRLNYQLPYRIHLEERAPATDQYDSTEPDHKRSSSLPVRDDDIAVPVR